jgi:hypothetical protein
MVETLHTIVMQAMKLILHKANVFALFFDEVTSINKESWFSIHVIPFKTRQKVIVSGMCS